jgi:hypothetical protein
MRPMVITVLLVTASFAMTRRRVPLRLALPNLPSMGMRSVSSCLCCLFSSRVLSRGRPSGLPFKRMPRSPHHARLARV